MALLMITFRCEETGGNDKSGGEASEGENANKAEGEAGEEAGTEAGAEVKKEDLVGHCNKALLEAYDIQSGWETVEDKNLLCPSVTKFNCCSYHAQLDIFRKWVLKGEREKILKTYR